MANQRQAERKIGNKNKNRGGLMEGEKGGLLARTSVE